MTIIKDFTGLESISNVWYAASKIREMWVQENLHHIQSFRRKFLPHEIFVAFMRAEKSVKDWAGSFYISI